MLSFNINNQNLRILLIYIMIAIVCTKVTFLLICNLLMSSFASVFHPELSSMRIHATYSLACNNLTRYIDQRQQPYLSDELKLHTEVVLCNHEPLSTPHVLKKGPLPHVTAESDQFLLVLPPLYTLSSGGGDLFHDSHSGQALNWGYSNSPLKTLQDSLHGIR